MGPHQGFIYMLLTFKLLKLFRKPVVLLCDILMLYGADNAQMQVILYVIQLSDRVYNVTLYTLSDS
jgi:hypothetical protein